MLGLFQPIDVRVLIKFLSYCDKTFDYFERLDNKHVFWQGHKQPWTLYTKLKLKAHKVDEPLEESHSGW